MYDFLFASWATFTNISNRIVSVIFTFTMAFETLPKYSNYAEFYHDF